MREKLFQSGSAEITGRGILAALMAAFSQKQPKFDKTFPEQRRRLA
jgi:hypothetical protein